MTTSNENIFRVTGPVWGAGPGEVPSQRPVTRSFDVFFDLRLSKRLSKQSRRWWFETPSRPLWRHCNETHGDLEKVVNILQTWQTLKDINMLECIWTCSYKMLLSRTLNAFLWIIAACIPYICAVFLHFVHYDISCLITGLVSSSLLWWLLSEYMWKAFQKVHLVHYMNCITTWYDIYVWTCLKKLK